MSQLLGRCKWADKMPRSHGQADLTNLSKRKTISDEVYAFAQPMDWS